MTTPESATPVRCRQCEGDPRASVQCKQCRGTGIGLPSSDGYLVWNVPLTRFTFTFRRTRTRVNAAFHILILIAALSCLAAPVIMLAVRGAWTDWMLRSYWTGGAFDISLFWTGWILLCFLIFRVRVYGGAVRPLPTWGKTRREQERLSQGNLADRTMDVSPFVLDAVWDVLESAYTLAEKTGRMDVQPVHLFTAALLSPFGGIFITRLGMNMDVVRPALVPLLQAGPSGSPTSFSLQARSVLLQAYVNAHDHHRKHVGVTELFLTSFDADPSLQEALDAAGYPATHVRQVAEWIRVQERMKEQQERFVALAQFKPKGNMNRVMTARATPLLNALSEDVTELAKNGHIAPMVAREREEEALLRAIESGRSSVVLVGEPGVGKTSIIENLARRMVEEDVPPELFDKRLVSVNLAELVSGDPSRASDRLLQLLREVALSGNIVLILEGVEALVGHGGGSPMDLAEAFSSELDRLAIRVIATTTPEAWSTHLERRSLGAKMTKVMVPEMDEEGAVRVLMAKVGFIEYQNRTFFTYDALERCVQLSGRYLQDERLPQSAIRIAEEAAVLARKTKGERAYVTGEDVANIVHEKTNIPVQAVSQSESEKLLNLEQRLHARVIGQEDAVTAVAQAMRRARAEVRGHKRPIANFLFLGPTGVGKTELAKALAAEYFSDENAMIRLDMSEFQHPNAVERVIGAPGDSHGGWLTDAIRHKPFAIVLLDELEKAHPDILSLFLQVMDDGRLTDSVGRTVDCTNIVLIATSNAGTQYVQDRIKAGDSLDQIKTGLLESELKGTYRPEFLNRFDGVIVFKPLTLDQVTQIAWLMVNQIAKRMEETKGITFRAEDEAVEELAHAGFDPIYGARPLRRVIQDRVENGLADLILRNAIKRRDTVLLKAGGQLVVE